MGTPISWEAQGWGTQISAPHLHFNSFGKIKHLCWKIFLFHYSFAKVNSKFQSSLVGVCSWIRAPSFATLEWKQCAVLVTRCRRLLHSTPSTSGFRSCSAGWMIPQQQNLQKLAATGGPTEMKAAAYIIYYPYHNKWKNINQRCWE